MVCHYEIKAEPIMPRYLLIKLGRCYLKLLIEAFFQKSCTEGLKLNLMDFFKASNDFFFEQKLEITKRNDQERVK